MNISILGSTGSIGTQTLDVVRDHSECFKVSAITGNSNIKLLEEQAREFNPELVCVADEMAAADLKVRISDMDIRVLGGKEKASEFMEKFKMIAIVTHVADARSCVLHPASTTHRQLSSKDLIKAGISDNLIRLSVGIENSEDIINDIAQALDSI